MQKNLLILHLESISRANLWQFRNELGTVWRLMSRSSQYTRFYTSSCSTQMTHIDFMEGDASSFDHCGHYKGSFAKRLVSPGIAGAIVAAGWRWGHFASSPFQQSILRRTGELVYVNNPAIPLLVDSLLREFRNSVRDRRPMAAYFWDDTSHLAFNCPPKANAASVQERLAISYRMVDAAINRILTGLMELGLWENTVIVAFGDHGDEPWSHGLNKGYSHSISPYASTCWTPMFIFDHGEKAGTTDQLASTVDLKETVVRYMLRDADMPPAVEAILNPATRRSRYSGIDLFSEKRDFAFSQNLFALQLEHDDPEKGMEKGYAVTDGTYRLVVSSGGGRQGAGGLEFFYDQMDPTNSRNLLDFFNLDENGDITGFASPPDAVGKHFLYSFRPAQVESLQNVFRTLKKELRDFVETKEENALPLNDGDRSLFPKEAFARAVKRLRGS